MSWHLVFGLQRPQIGDRLPAILEFDLGSVGWHLPESFRDDVKDVPVSHVQRFTKKQGWRRRESMLDNGTIALPAFPVAGGAEPPEDDLAPVQIGAVLRVERARQLFARANKIFDRSRVVKRRGSPRD